MIYVNINILILAIWCAIRMELTADIFGCAFHMNQAILRKIGEIGLKISYQQDAGYFKIFMYIGY